MKRSDTQKTFTVTEAFMRDVLFVAQHACGASRAIASGGASSAWEADMKTCERVTATIEDMLE